MQDGSGKCASTAAWFFGHTCARASQLQTDDLI
jgi:hypothetical protein